MGRTCCGFRARPNKTGILRAAGGARAAKSGFNLVERVAEMVVNGGDAGEVELSRRNSAC